MFVEFLGIARERSGVSELELDARTLGQLLEALPDRLPGLRDVIHDGVLHRAFSANLNGDVFVSDPGTLLDASDHLLILSADVGG